MVLNIAYTFHNDDTPSQPWDYLTLWREDATGVNPDTPLLQIDSNNSWRIENSTSSPTLFIDAVNKRVGIGITTPDEKLNVIGNADSSATLYAADADISLFV